jgi:hypothetical protein
VAAVGWAEGAAETACAVANQLRFVDDPSVAGEQALVAGGSCGLNALAEQQRHRLVEHGRGGVPNSCRSSFGNTATVDRMLDRAV